MISEKLKNIILRELSLTNFPLTENTFAKDVPGWDSLKNLSIIMSIEEEFNISFLTEEIINISNIGDIQRLIENKIKNNLIEQ